MKAPPAHTFLFADLAGFTALTEAHGDEEATELVTDFFEQAGTLLPAHDAKEIKRIGDALMLLVDEAGAAVDLGLALVDEVGSRPGFPVIRAGMHTGTAVERNGDWYGAAVNLAARVSGTAGGNEVLLTEATREAAGSLEGVELRARGVHRFKNVGDPVRLYAALREGRELAELVIDPVCRMTVEPERAIGRLTHEGHEYLFCSLECAAAFADNPSAYLAR
jgi:adenylate cyclase